MNNTHHKVQCHCSTAAYDDMGRPLTRVQKSCVFSEVLVALLNSAHVWVWPEVTRPLGGGQQEGELGHDVKQVQDDPEDRTGLAVQQAPGSKRAELRQQHIIEKKRALLT